MNRTGHEEQSTPAERLESGRSAACSDAELVHAARCGDKRAFVEIVARHQAMVCGIALGILADFALSEDAGQEAFLTAWRKIHELREPEKLRAWLGQIARNAALGHLRRDRGHDTLEQATELPDDSPAPDEVTANEEEASLVLESLAKLPETYRLPLILFYRDGKSVRAVAETLAISEDAVKQRLSRGREMLRDRMSGLVENVLTRTRPTPIFTMAIAAAIGALVTPAAVASSVFSAAATAGTTSTAASSASLLAAINLSKTMLFIAVAAAVVCVPMGYQIGTRNAAPTAAAPLIDGQIAAARPKAPPSFENSAIFAEWKRLHELYGTTAEAMPNLYQAIAGLKDPFRRRAFRAALIAEWAQVDPTNGLAFFLRPRRGIDAGQRQQFFEEWLTREPRAAVETLMVSGQGWESIARASLSEIARRVPEHVTKLVARLPTSSSFQDTRVRDAFALVAQRDFASTRATAEAMAGPNRSDALAGVAYVWARKDLNAALTWATKLPDGTDREEIIRAALLGRAAMDPISALERVNSVPPGGRPHYFASTTGARVLKEAAAVDFDATVGWLATHPGRLGDEDLMGLAQSITDKLNSDAAGFLTQYASAGSLAAMLPAIDNALLNASSGQCATVWDWLKAQSEDETVRRLRRTVISSAARHDPAQAFRLATDLPGTSDRIADVQLLADSLLDGGTMVDRVDKLVEQAPARLRHSLLESAFNHLRADSMADPQAWIARLAPLPEASRARSIQTLARVWAEQSPQAAIAWVASLPASEARAGAVAGIAQIWATKDSQSASAWVAMMPAGVERDRSAEGLVLAIAEKYPREAWDWAVSIGDAGQRASAAGHAAKMMAAQDPATAREWIEHGPFTPETRALLSAAVTASRSGGLH